jgi:hypothetical protein
VWRRGSRGTKGTLRVRRIQGSESHDVRASALDLFGGLNDVALGADDGWSGLVCRFDEIRFSGRSAVVADDLALVLIARRTELS